MLRILTMTVLMLAVGATAASGELATAPDQIRIN